MVVPVEHLFILPPHTYQVSFLINFLPRLNNPNCLGSVQTPVPGWIASAAAAAAALLS